MAKTDLTAARLRELLHYDPQTGIFTRNSRCDSARIGCISPQGYRVIEVAGGKYRAHMLAWLFVNGEFPKTQILHIDGNKDGNQIDNLKEICREVTPEFVRKTLSYDPASGIFIWRTQASRGTKVGSIAGCKGPTGYWSIKLWGKHYSAHRLAWFYSTGSWPKDQIDHIDGNPLNNCIANLRESTQAENVQNFPVVSRNTSGHPGVCFDKSRGKWVARISTGNKVANLGRFDHINDAANAYKSAKAEYHTFNPIVRQ